MKTVYKYQIPFGDMSRVSLPKDAKLLKFGVGAQAVDVDNKPRIFVWALIDTDTTETEEHVFRIAGTGHPLHELTTTGLVIDGHCAYLYVDTVFDNPSVWHIFEAVNPGLLEALK